jgi:long-subunit fatty acid transport protein
MQLDMQDQSVSSTATFDLVKLGSLSATAPDCAAGRAALPAIGRNGRLRAGAIRFQMTTPMRAWLATSVALVAVLGTLASRVRAGGYDLLPGGTQAVARGGAIAARPENAMMLEHNPAGLSLLSGQQLLLNVDVPIHSMCVDLYGYYGWGAYLPGDSQFAMETNDQLNEKYGRTPLPPVCNSAPVGGIPQLAWAGKLTDSLGVAVGFVRPTQVTGLQYGGADGTVAVDGLENGGPTPTRYQAIRTIQKTALWPSIGAGYRIAPQLQLGLTAQLTGRHRVARLVQPATSGTQPATDWLADFDTHDDFIPTLTVSANSKPIPALDLMVAFHWSDKFRGSGKVTYETNTFHHGATSGPIPTRNLPINLPLVQVGLPWTLTAGARYAGLLSKTEESASKPTSLGDPLDRELWDVELDATYTFNSVANTSKTMASGDATIISRNIDGPDDRSTTRGQTEVTIDRHLRDSVMVSAGGSYSVVPRTLALEAGTFFETRGMDPAYASVDVFDFQRIGFGVGLMARVGDFDLLAAYGHIFQETLEVAPPPHQNVEQAKFRDPTSGFDQRVGGTITVDGTRVGATVLSDPSAPLPRQADAVARQQATSAAPSPMRPDRVINAGRYTASFEVISVGAIFHF